MNGMREKERGVEAKLKYKTLERKIRCNNKKNSDISSRDLIKKMSLKYFRI